MTNIRQAAIDDCERLYLINRDSLGYDYAIEETRKRLSFVLSAKTNKLFVAEIDGVVAGYIHVADYDCIYADSLKNILALAVDKKYQGLGVGRQLLEKAEEWSRSDGSVGVRLVSGMNRAEAHKFYAHCGYTMRKEQKNFIKLF